MSKDFGLLEKEYEEGGTALDYSREMDTGTQWQRFEREVIRLQKEAKKGTVYKVLYLGRHGQGVHNVAEKKYGTAEWDVSDPEIKEKPTHFNCCNLQATCLLNFPKKFHPLQATSIDSMLPQRYWAAQEGDASSRWVDPHLTATGIEQAHAVHAFWKHQLAVAKTPPPQTYYCSPLYRCLETANLTFTGLDLPADRPYKPIAKEVRPFFDTWCPRYSVP